MRVWKVALYCRNRTEKRFSHQDSQNASPRADTHANIGASADPNADTGTQADSDPRASADSDPNTLTILLHAPKVLMRHLLGADRVADLVHKDCQEDEAGPPQTE